MLLHLSNTGDIMASTLIVKDFKKTYDSARKAVPCNILIEFVMPIEAFRYVKTRLNAACRKVQTGEYLKFKENMLPFVTEYFVVLFACLKF